MLTFFSISDKNDELYMSSSAQALAAAAAASGASSPPRTALGAVSVTPAVVEKLVEKQNIDKIVSWLGSELDSDAIQVRNVKTQNSLNRLNYELRGMRV